MQLEQYLANFSALLQLLPVRKLRLRVVEQPVHLSRDT